MLLDYMEPSYQEAHAFDAVTRLLALSLDDDKTLALLDERIAYLALKGDDDDGVGEVWQAIRTCFLRNM